MAHNLSRLRAIWPLVWGLGAFPGAGDPGENPPGLLFFNEDDSARFGLAPAGEITPEHLDRVVDGLAQTQVQVMVICCGAQKTNFPSQAWEIHSAGFDPNQGDDQPYLAGAEPETVASFRQWAENLNLLLQQGVDPTGRLIQRCREQGIAPWVSIRMNDMHDAHRIDSPIHSRFWREHPEYWRYPDRFNTWTDRALDYGQQPVRDYTMALIRELCDRYDFDGLELDWLRFPYHFREGEEIEKGKRVTEWMKEVYAVVQAAAQRRGPPVVLAARVPARPEVATGIGLDAVTWAQQGTVDHLIVSPFWTTTDFDIPVEEWRRLLAGTGVPVTAGLESGVQAHPARPRQPNTPERMRGFAVSALARGSEGIYLFNLMGLQHKLPFLFQELGSLETLQGKDRNHLQTYPDIQIPGNSRAPALPQQLDPQGQAEFRLHLGPRPEGATGQVLLILSGEGATDPALLEVRINGHPTQFAPPAEGSPVTFRCGGSCFQAGYNTITVRNGGDRGVGIESVELAIRF